MTIRANYWRAFVRIYLSFAVAIALFVFMRFFLGSKEVDPVFLCVMALSSLVIAAFGAVGFIPREISWDDQAITFRDFVGTKKKYEWSQLEGYGVYSDNFLFNYNTWMIRFCDPKQMFGIFPVKIFQIIPCGYDAADWRQFMDMLQKRFPDKKTWVWFGWTPIRWGR